MTDWRPWPHGAGTTEVGEVYYLRLRVVSHDDFHGEIRAVVEPIDRNKEPSQPLTSLVLPEEWLIPAKEAMKSALRAGHRVPKSDSLDDRTKGDSNARTRDSDR